MTLLMCLAGWFAVSFPVALFFGRLMRVCEQRERARRPHGLRLPPDPGQVVGWSGCQRELAAFVL